MLEASIRRKTQLNNRCLLATKQEIGARAALELLALPLGADCEARRARGLDMLLATLGSEALGWTADERAAYLEAARPHMTAAEQVPGLGFRV